MQYQAAGPASLPDEARIAMLLQTIGLYENMLLSAVM